MNAESGQNLNLNWPLMDNNITRHDLDTLIQYLQQDDPRLTQSEQVRSFESEWSNWLGVTNSVFVNSGASANLLTMAALKERVGSGEIIVPALTWVSDIASVMQTGFKPVFVDIHPRTLGMDSREIINKLTRETKAVFITHILGYNAINEELLEYLSEKQILLIEDVCESHGATFQGKKLGTFGIMSNFSFYYAHHMSTIEGGMISTDDPELYQILRMLRSHGMVRESTDDVLKRSYLERYPDLNPDFIFALPAYNVRSSELNAVIGRSQLKRLDGNNLIRRNNLSIFLDNLDSEIYRTDFALEGNSNYALTLILKHPDEGLLQKVIQCLNVSGVEFRRGTSGGGNQLRQPYLRDMFDSDEYENYPETDHIHYFGFYLGNYPGLDASKITLLCERLNGL